MDDAVRNLLSSFTGNTVDPYPAAHAPSPNLGIAWNLMTEDTDLPLTAEEQAVANISSAILHRYDELPASDDDFDERSEDENHQNTQSEPVVTDVPAEPGKAIFCYGN
jgi:hypothetical protein